MRFDPTSSQGEDLVSSRGSGRLKIPDELFVNY